MGSNLDGLIAFVGQYFYLVVLVLALLAIAWWYWSRRPGRNELIELVVAAVIIGVVALVLAQIGHRIISDPRPFMETGRPALIPSSVDNGFPSDHTLLMGAAAAVITLFVGWQMGLVFWALAVLVGLARVYAGVHHPLDIAGSLVIVVLATLIYLGARELWQRWRTAQAGSQA